MVRKIIILLLAVIAILAIVVTLQPSEFNVSRELKIEAPAKDIFEQVNNFQNWPNWSPWKALDPDQKVTLQGPVKGENAIMTWSGNSQVGEGTITITESKKNESIKMKLDIKRPLAASHNGEFTFKPEGKATVVTWSMYGHKDFIAKAVGLVMNCDKMVGEQFEKGLINLQNVVVKPSAGNAINNNAPVTTSVENAPATESPASPTEAGVTEAAPSTNNPATDAPAGDAPVNAAPAGETPAEAKPAEAKPADAQ